MRAISVMHLEEGVHGLDSGSLINLATREWLKSLHTTGQVREYMGLWSLSYYIKIMRRFRWTHQPENLGSYTIEAGRE